MIEVEVLDTIKGGKHTKDRTMMKLSGDALTALKDRMSNMRKKPLVDVQGRNTRTDEEGNTVHSYYVMTDDPSTVLKILEVGNGDD